MLGAPPLKLSRGLQGSTFLLGHRKEASGIRPRPHIANAATVIPQAVALLEDRSNYQAKLEVSWRCDDFLLPKVRWDEAKKRLKIGQAQEEERLVLIEFHIYAKDACSSALNNGVGL